MTEADLTQGLLKDLRGHQFEWKTLKLCDRFTRGVPDLVSILGWRSAWWEVKKLHQEREQLLRPKDWCDNLVQLRTLVVCHGFYYVHDTYRHQTLFAWARDVEEVLRDHLTLADRPIKIAGGRGIPELACLLNTIILRGETHEYEFNLQRL